MFRIILRLHECRGVARRREYRRAAARDRSDNGHTVAKHLNNAQYMPSFCKEFGTIEIDIRDYTVHTAPFERI